MKLELDPFDVVVFLKLVGVWVQAECQVRPVQGQRGSGGVGMRIPAVIELREPGQIGHSKVPWQSASRDECDPRIAREICKGIWCAIDQYADAPQSF